MTASQHKGTILAAGRGLNPILIRYFSSLTGKSDPTICLLPTASGDHPQWIENWHNLGKELGFEPVVQPMFISSFDQHKEFRDVLLSADGIYVGGGNTLNMLAIWRVHGIIDILREAWHAGIPLGGGSAGGICWFESGLTDSRPKELTAMPAMGWLKGSFAPHYLTEPGRREYYHRYILSGELHNGYGCDETVGLQFNGTDFVKAVGSVRDAQVFEVRSLNGTIEETQIPVEFVG